jgi:hypothetical protein
LPILLRPAPELNASRRIIKFSIPTEKCHRLTFSFIRMQIRVSGLQPSMILSGFGYDGKRLGCWGENFTLKVQTLKGLHLARDSLAGFTAIRVKDNEKWSEWFGTPGDGVDDVELEWETKKNLILHFDVGWLRRLEIIFPIFRLINAENSQQNVRCWYQVAGVQSSSLAQRVSKLTISYQTECMIQRNWSLDGLPVVQDRVRYGAHRCHSLSAENVPIPPGLRLPASNFNRRCQSANSFSKSFHIIHSNEFSTRTGNSIAYTS